MTNSIKRTAASALALSLGLALSACGTVNDGPRNMSLYSTNEPVVERASFMLDLNAGGSGLSMPEQARLADWFETMDLNYGDRVDLDDPVGNPATRADVAEVAARYGLLLGNQAPVTQGYLNPGTVRVVVTRSVAYVPGCPIWDDEYGFERGNQTSSGFGCAINGNLAAMVANPEDLLEGQHGTGETVIMTSNRAIDSYRNAQPTGGGGTTLPEVSSSEGGN